MVGLNSNSGLHPKSTYFTLDLKCEWQCHSHNHVPSRNMWHARFLFSYRAKTVVSAEWILKNKQLVISVYTWGLCSVLTVLTGTYPRRESSFGFVFLNFLLPLVPLWLNVQLSSFQHPSWSEEFPFPELRFPKEI